MAELLNKQSIAAFVGLFITLAFVSTTDAQGVPTLSEVTPAQEHAASISPASTSFCRGDVNGNGVVTVDEILQAVNSALNGCGTAPVTLAALSGTYEFIDFTVTFPDGSRLTPSGVTSFSGTFTIAPNGSVQQIVTLNGTTITIHAILSVTADNMLHIVNTAPSSCTVNLEFTFDGNMLTTFWSRCEGANCGGNYSETDVWRRTSSQAALRGNEAARGEGAADVEQAALGGVTGALEQIERK